MTERGRVVVVVVVVVTTETPGGMTTTKMTGDIPGSTETETETTTDLGQGTGTVGTLRIITKTSLTTIDLWHTTGGRGEGNLTTQNDER